MRINSLEETESNPDVNGEDVQVAAEHAVEDGAEDSARAENEYLCGVRVLCRETEGRRVLVVNLVDVLVQDTGVKRLVG